MVHDSCSSQKCEKYSLFFAVVGRQRKEDNGEGTSHQELATFDEDTADYSTGYGPTLSYQHYLDRTTQLII